MIPIPDSFIFCFTTIWCANMQFMPEARVFYVGETVERKCEAYLLSIEADMNLGCSVAKWFEYG